MKTQHISVALIFKLLTLSAIAQNPVADFSASSTQVCTGNCISFTDLSTGAPTAWSWSFAGGTPATSTQQNPTVCYGSDGLYDVTLTVTNNNGNDTKISNAYIAVGSVQIDSFNTTLASCFNIPDGSAQAIVSGGFTPYTYLWNDNNSQTTQTAINLYPTSYTVTVTDIAGCTDTNQAYIQILPFSSQTTYTPATCNFCDGSATVIPNGGVPPYSYLWSNGGTTQTIANLCPAYYNVTVFDNNGCERHDVQNVGTATTIQYTSSITYPSCTSNNGSATLYPFNGATPYSYQWDTNSGSQTTQTATGLGHFLYLCTITDANNCSDTAYVHLNYNFNLNMSSTPKSSCSNNDGKASAVPLYGQPPYTYAWSNLGNTQTITGLDVGSYTVTVTDAINCTVSDSIIVYAQCDSVWPGDCDYNGIVNNLDLLPIGLGFGHTGPVRVGATLNWVVQYCDNWQDTLNGNVNYKHIDCNGDGVIDNSDTTAIGLNYGFTHYKMAPYNDASASDPSFYISILNDTVYPDAPITATLDLGSGNVPASNVYGVAFSILYNPAYISPNAFNFNFNNCWMGAFGTDMIAVYRNDYGNNRMDVAITRTDHNDVSGNGQIGTLKLTAASGLPINAQMYLQVVPALMISSDGTPLPVNAGTDSAIVSSTGPHGTVDVPRVQVFPNPAGDWVSFILHGMDLKSGLLIEVSDILGNTVLSKQLHPGGLQGLDISGLPGGLYQYKLSVPAVGRFCGKLIKM